MSNGDDQLLGGGPGGFSLEKAMDAGANTNAHLGRKKMEDVANKIAEQTKVTYDSSTDLATVQAPSWVVQKVMGDSLKMQDIEAIYDRQIAEKQARIDQLGKHPWQNTLAQIAASMAANDPNPYTRGIGQAATRLNPTRDELQGQQAGLLKERAGLGERDLSRDVSLMEHEERLEAMRTGHKEALERFSQQEKDRQERLGIEQRRERESERENKQRDKDREATLKEHQREFNERQQDRKLKKDETSATKVYNTLIKFTAARDRLTKDIAAITDKLQTSREKLETDLSAFGASEESKQARMREFQKRQKEDILEKTRLETSLQWYEDKIQKLDTDSTESTPVKKGTYDPATGKVKF